MNYLDDYLQISHKSGRELNLKEMQTIGVYLLKKFDQLCLEYNINYTLAGGSLIGAIRHRGYIPWDDDIDIFILRPDYDKLINCIKRKQTGNEETILFTPELDNCYMPYGQFCDMKYTKVIAYCPRVKGSSGMWIDVFPIEGCETDFNSFEQRLEKINNFLKRYNQIRGTKLPITFSLGFVRIIKAIGKRLLYGHYDIDDELRKLTDIMSEIKIKHDGFCSNLHCPTYNNKEYYPVSDFVEFTRVPFENIDVSVIKRYDDYLTRVYGDYMKLPPVKEQIPKHDVNKVYWK